MAEHAVIKDGYFVVAPQGIEAVPLKNIEQAWQRRDLNDKRIVIVP